MSTLNVTVRAEYTPNPNSLKFICSETLYPYGGSLSYSSQAAAEAAENPVAIRLFKIGLITSLIVSKKNKQINIIKIN